MSTGTVTPKPSVRTASASLLDGISGKRHLIARFDQIRRERFVIGFVAALAWAALAALGCMFLCVWGDLLVNFPPYMRVLAWFVAIVTFFVVVYFRLSRVHSVSTDPSLAHQMDSVCASGGEIESGLDFCARERVGISTIHRELSEKLADLAVRRAAVLADSVADEAIIPTKETKQSFGILGLALFTTVVLSAFLPRLAHTELMRFLLPFGDHPPWSRYMFEVAPEGATILYGHPFDVEAVVTGPDVQNVEMVLIDPASVRRGQVEDVEPMDVLPMFPGPDGQWYASIAEITQPFSYYLRTRRARSKVYSLHVNTVPRIEEIQVEVVSPLYTGLSPYRGTLPVSGLEGLPGTKVKITAVSNRPLSMGKLKIEAGVSEQVDMSCSDDPRSVTGEFRIQQMGHIDLTIHDEEGRSSDPYNIPVRVTSDQPPIVRIREPKATSFATPTATLPVKIVAEDDFGVRKCQLYRNLNNSRFLPTDLELPVRIQRHVQPTVLLPLAEYGLQPGDVIKLFARAEDNDPFGPDAPVGKGAESSIVTIRIISEEALQRLQTQRAGMNALRSRHQQVQRRLENLAEEVEQLQKQLDKLPEDSPLGDQLREKMKQLAEQIKNEAAAIEQLADSPLPLDLDKKLAPKLKELAKSLREQAEQLSKSAEDPKQNRQSASKQLEQLRNALKKQQQRQDKQSMQPLEQLASVLPLKQAENDFVRLVLMQRRLAERLRTTSTRKDGKNPSKRARLRELEEEQNRLRNQLNKLLDQIEEHANGLPDDPAVEELRKTARKFVNDVRKSNAIDEMTSAEESLAKFDRDQGYTHADAAATILEKFLSQCQSMGEAAGSCLPKFNPGMGKSMQKTLNQLVPGLTTGQNGMGMGAAGQGGYSSQMDTSENVGIYGGTPYLDPQSSSRMGTKSSNNASAISGSTQKLRPQQETENSYSTGRIAPAYGGGDWGVPTRYRRQTGRYLLKLAEELEE